MSQFQVKYLDEDDWQEVSETFVLEKLVGVFDRITPLLAEMIRGKEIITPEGFFRMKNCGNEGKDY
jgi:hypothetical protein